MKTGSILLFAMCLTVSGALASDADDSTHPLTMSGLVAVEVGQIGKGVFNSLPIDHKWMQNLVGRLTLEKSVGERIKITLSPEMKLWYSFPQASSFIGTQSPHFSPYFHQADLVFSLGNRERWPIDVRVGLSPYKYNQDANNLGEYLFRSGTYPQYLVTNFDFASTRLLGLRVSSTLFDVLTQDVFMISNHNQIPLHDGSLAYVAALNLFHGVLDLGGGVEVMSVFSANKQVTTPNANSTSYIDEKGDTLHYTFQGTKLMGRIALDPKPRRLRGVMGAQDLRIFAEAAVLGTRDYVNYAWIGDTAKDALGNPLKSGDGASDSLINLRLAKGFSVYDDILRRIPVMAGLNLPTFKLLDVLSLQVEWYPSVLPNSMQNIIVRGQPMPEVPDDYEPRFYHRDDVRWSVYARRSIGTNFCIVGQVASDHLRLSTVNMQEEERDDLTRSASDWYYMIKLIAYL